MSTDYETLYGSDDDDNLTAHGELQGGQYVYYATIHGGEGDDIVTAENDFGSEHYALYGDGGNDMIIDRAYNAKVLLSGGDGDDTIVGIGTRQRVDGGDGYDKLDSGGGSSSFALDAVRIKNIEELVVDGWTSVGDFDLRTLQKISVAADCWDAGLFFSHAINLDDLTIETNGAELRLDGSSEADRFDLRSYNSRFVVFAGGGDDTVFAGAGGTHADGGYGNDYVEGSEESDELSGGDSQDANAYDTVLGRGGDDQIDFNSGGGLLDGGMGEDTLFVLARNDDPISMASVELKNIEIIDFFSFTEINLGAVDLSDVKKLMGDAELFMGKHSSFRDVAILKDSVITIRGSRFDDASSFAGSEGTLHFHGRQGNDTLQADGGENWLWGDSGDDTLVGSLGLDHLNGGEGNDAIEGGNESDDIASGTGADRISGGSGDDTLKLLILNTEDVKIVDAGSDDDKIFARDSVAVAGHGQIDGGAGHDILYASGDITGHGIVGVETLLLRGKLTASAATFDGFDNIFARTAFPSSDTRIRLELSSGGHFTWHGGSTVQDASLNGSHQRDILDFSAAENAWSINGNDGRDAITGTPFRDNLSGGGGSDVLYSGSGNDNDFGGLGNDTIYGGDGDDFIQGNDGRDHIDGGKGLNQLDGGSGDDILLGSGTRDEIDGSEGDDTILGYSRKSFLTGGEGNDTLVAGAGLDYMHGDDGSDTFVFSDGTGEATVYDFDKKAGEKDLIDLSTVSTIEDFQDLISHHIKMSKQGDALLITFGSSEIALVGVKSDQLDQSDFIF